MVLTEPDIDQIIQQKPEIVLIDELAHSMRKVLEIVNDTRILMNC